MELRGTSWGPILGLKMLDFKPKNLRGTSWNFVETSWKLRGTSWNFVEPRGNSPGLYFQQLLVIRGFWHMSKLENLGI